MTWEQERDHLQEEIAGAVGTVREAADVLGLPMHFIRDALHAGAQLHFNVERGYRAGTGAVRLAILAAAACEAETEDAA